MLMSADMDTTETAPADAAYNSAPQGPAIVDNDGNQSVPASSSEPQMPADVTANSAPQSQADMALGIDAAGNSELHVPADNDSMLPADAAQIAEPCGPTDMPNDAEPCVRTDGEFCEFQYIEIVPLDSPKEPENNNGGFCPEVKEEIKKEPGDVCNII